MSSTMDSVSTILGVDRVNTNGKMILIEEQHGTNADFLISSIISNAIKKSHGICLVLFHNTFGHYHNVGMRLGYNLNMLKDKGQVTVAEPMNTIALDVERMCDDTLEKESVLVESTSSTNSKIVQKLFKLVKDKYYEATKCSDTVVIIMDDLSHLCDFGLSLRDCMYYIRNVRSLVESQSTSQLCILTHSYKEDPQSCTPDALANCLKHMAHLFVAVEPFKTGYSSDASGKMTVNWRIDSIRREYHWPEKSTYLYKLMDRQVKVFAPGTATTLP